MADQTERLDGVAYAILGNVENGPWVLITDPALRAVVGEYVADACHSIAAAAGLDEAMEKAHDAMPVRLAAGGRLIDDGARERLARHLWLQSRPDDPYAQPHWDHGGDQHVNKAGWRNQADKILAIVTGKG